MKNKFKDFDDFLNEISEGLNNPVNVSWEKSPSKWNGTFIVDDIPYKIVIKNHSDLGNFFSFKFERNGKFELVNDVKRAFSVIPTIEKAVDDFLEEVKPDMLIFTASDKSMMRKKMYDRYCSNASKKFKMFYETSIIEGTDTVVYKLISYTCDGIEMAKALNKIKKELELKP